MKERYCPSCGVDTQAEPIPQESIDKGYYAKGSTHFSKWCGHSNFDYVTHWSCPNGCLFTRFGEPAARTPETIEAEARDVVRRLLRGAPSAA